MSRLPLLAMLSLAACSYSSLDDEILVTVVSADVSVDPTVPDVLAPIRIRLRLHGGPSASSLAVLDKVVLQEPSTDPLAGGAELLRLELRFPEAFNAFIHESEVKTVDLENAGTLSSDLEPLCGENLTLTVWLADTDEANSGTLDGQSVTITCP